MLVIRDEVDLATIHLETDSLNLEATYCFFLFYTQKTNKFFIERGEMFLKKWPNEDCFHPTCPRFYFCSWESCCSKTASRHTTLHAAAAALNLRISLKSATPQELFVWRFSLSLSIRHRLIIDRRDFQVHTHIASRIN